MGRNQKNTMEVRASLSLISLQVFFLRIPLEIRYNLNSFSSKSLVPNFIAGSSPVKKFRQMFLDGCHAGLL